MANLIILNEFKKLKRMRCNPALNITSIFLIVCGPYFQINKPRLIFRFNKLPIYLI